MKENMITEAIRYITTNHLEADANKLANKVGNIYVACLMIYRNISLTQENIECGKQISKAIRSANKTALKAVMESV